MNEFTKSIIEKNELIEKVKGEIEKLQTENQESDRMMAGSMSEQSLKLLQESVLLTDDNRKRFTQLFDKVHQEFFIRLKEKFPGLSPAETRYFTLLN